ncbi:hypothetical protein CPB86DRAFT_800696 [Serendipita vermifera]|nr:hypothetical protein CPB86DRAFT_800696 [Serendipita vermifera]
MNHIPDDILLLILEVYVHGYQLSPTSLLAVCRRWNDLVLSNPTSWSRVRILIKSLQSIPTIVAGASGKYGLLSYLSRSEKEGTNILLDIEIKQMQPEDVVDDHDKTCPHEIDEDRGDCVSDECELPKYRRQQLKSLLKVLIERGNQHLKRWGTFKLEPIYDYDMGLECTDRPLTLSETRICFPNLYSITLDNMEVDFGNIALPSLKRLVQHGMNSIKRLKCGDTVEMLATPIWSAVSGYFATWPRLHTLAISAVCLSFLLEGTVTSLNLNKLILDLSGVRDRDLTEARSKLRRIESLDANQSLKTVILLRARMHPFFEILKYNSSMTAPNWIVGSHCSCFSSYPEGDPLAPCYRIPNGTMCEPEANQLNSARRAFSEMCMRKMKVESLDSCTTELFARLYAEIDPELRTALSEVEIDRIKKKAPILHSS